MTRVSRTSRISPLINLTILIHASHHTAPGDIPREDPTQFPAKAGPSPLDYDPLVNPSNPAPISSDRVRGLCKIFFAFDIGHSVVLDHAERLLASAAPQRVGLLHSRRAPASFE